MKTIRPLELKIQTIDSNSTPIGTCHLLKLNHWAFKPVAAAGGLGDGLSRGNCWDFAKESFFLANEVNLCRNSCSDVVISWYVSALSTVLESTLWSRLQLVDPQNQRAVWIPLSGGWTI